MLRHISLLITTALLLFLAVPQAVTADAPTLDSRTRSTLAWAAYDNFMIDGCVDQGIYIEARESVVKTTGQPEREAMAYVSIWRHDNCSNTTLFEGGRWVQMSRSALHVDPKMRSADLTLTFDIYNLASKVTVPVHIRLTWTSTGTCDYEHGACEAVASGLVQLGEQNLTPWSSSFAEIHSDH